MLGYAFDGGWAAKNSSAVARFLRLAARAKDILAESEAEWQRLAPRIGVTDKAGLEIYRQRYSEGIPRRPIADEESTTPARFTSVLAELGGQNLVGPAQRARQGHLLRSGEGRLNLAARLSSLGLLMLAAWYAGAEFAGPRMLPGPLCGRRRDLERGASRVSSPFSSARRWRGSPSRS